MFYTYLHRRESDNQPFYIGQGTIARKRAYSNENRNAHWHNTVKKHGLKVEIVAEWKTHDEVIEHEKFLIACFRDMGHQLVNMTDGGEGMTGWVPSAETKKKISLSQKGRTKETHSGVAKSADSQRGRTKESHKYLEERSQARKGTSKETSQSVARQSEALSGRKKETHLSVARVAEKKLGRTKQTCSGVARQAEKLTGRTKENNASVAKMAEKKRGLTKENNAGVAKMSQILRGRTKETHAGVAKQAEKMAEKMIGRFWVNNQITSKFLDKDSPIPEGFILGRLKKAKQ